MASSVCSASWELASHTTHGDYYPSRQRPERGTSLLQIGQTQPSSSPQASKQPFPPAIITVNHSDSTVHALCLLWSGHSALSSQQALLLECALSSVIRTQTNPFATLPVHLTLGFTKIYNKASQSTAKHHPLK